MPLRPTKIRKELQMMKSEHNEACMKFLMDGHYDIAELVGDSLEKEVEEFVELLRSGNMPAKITESTIQANSNDQIAKMYAEDVKGTFAHELVELYVKIDNLMKNFGFDLDAYKKAYSIYYKDKHK